MYDESDIYRDVSLAVAPGVFAEVRRGGAGVSLCSLTVLLELPIFVVYIPQDVRIRR